MSERVVRVAIAAAAALNAGLGLWIALAPRSFFDAIADFGAYNAHDLRDVATWYLAIGATLVVAAVRPAWRVPLLVFASLQSAAHAVNHVVDVGDSHPSWVGPVDVATLAVAAAVLALLGWVARTKTDSGSAP